MVQGYGLVNVEVLVMLQENPLRISQVLDGIPVLFEQVVEVCTTIVAHPVLLPFRQTDQLAYGVNQFSLIDWR
jgi:hypothetical protein